MSHEMMRSCL